MLLLYFLIVSPALSNKINLTNITDINHTSKLAQQVWNNSFTDAKCLVIWSEDNFFEFKAQTLIIRILSSNNKECDSSIMGQLMEAYNSNCNIYIVHITEPNCFFKLWNQARESTIYRHNPKIFFLPVSTTKYSDELLSNPFAEISADILVAEIEILDEWPFKLYTNNFAVRIGTENRTAKIYLDEWHPDLGFRHNADLYPNKIKDLKGKEVGMATFQYLPYVNLSPFDGTEARMLKEYCKKFNCTIKIHDDGFLWGSITGYREGNGIAGTVYKGNADFGAAAMCPWLEYYQYLDYSSCYMYAGVAMLVPKPVRLSGWRTPFLPFGLTMWVIYVCCLLVSSFLLYWLTFATIKFSRFGDEIKMKKQFISLPDSIIRSIGMSVLQQPAILINSPVRYLFTSFEFLYLILTACYSAELSSYLTVPQFTKPIDTYREFAHSGLHWLADHDVWIYGLVHSDIPDDIAIVDNFRRTSEEDLMKMTPTGKYGIALEGLPAGHYTEPPHVTEEAIKNSHVMDELLYGSTLTFVLDKGSAYTESLNMHINRILDGGLFIFWEGESARRFLSNRVQMALKFARKKTKDGGEPKILTTDHIQGAFIIYSIGIFISSCFLAIEIILKNKNYNRTL